MRTLNLSSGDDAFFSNYGSETINGLSGHDFISGGLGDDLLNGGTGNDVLVGGVGNDTLYGGSGTDAASFGFASSGVTASLLTGVATFAGGETDTLISIDNLTGTGFNDQLTGDGNANVLYGMNGNDGLRGGAGGDQLHGGNGSDNLYGGLGRDWIDGGAGVDALYFTEATAGVSLSLLLGQGFAGEAQGDRYFNIENVYGSEFDDYISGTNLDNYLEGRGGNDTVYGFGGKDSLHAGEGDDSMNGGAGDDLLYGGAGADTMTGDTGFDVVTFLFAEEGVRVDLEDGGKNLGDAEGDSYSGIEKFDGSYHDDIMRGDSLGNSFYGNEGNDTLLGRDGDDSLVGWHGADNINGGNGNDTVHGGVGADTMRGGDGFDRFFFAGSVESGATEETSDLILDFVQGEDIVDLTAIDAKPGGANDTFQFLGTGAFTGAGGELRYVIDGGETIVQGDRDGDSVADFTIRFDDAIAFAAGDFVL